MKINDRVTVDIESLAYGGEGVGRVDKKVIFVPLSAPGDRIEAMIYESKKNYLRGRIEQFKTLSQTRTVPLCDYFGECGGCQWQHLKYDYQLETKEQIVKNSLERIAKICDYQLLPIIPSPKIFGYRCRARIQCLAQRRHVLGFYKADSKEIVPIEKCELLPPFLNQILRKITEFLNSSEHIISFSEIEVMGNVDKEESVISLSADSLSKDHIPNFLKSLKHSIPNIYGVAIQTGHELEIQTECFGNCALEFSEKIFPQGSEGPISFAMRSHIHTFNQVNLEQNNNMVKTIYDWIDPSRNDTVVDLFCGMGNLSIPLASSVKRVIGIENNPHAIDDACYNSHGHHAFNCEFIHNDALMGLRQLHTDGIGVDVLLIDPPRKGCKTLIPEIAECKPSRIIYVSCNPTTMARDVGLLYYSNYRLSRVQPIDMFPHTYHVETIAELVPT